MNRRGSFTNDIDSTADDNGPLAANHVGKITSDEGTKESTGGKDRNDERSVAGADGAGGAGETIGTNRALDFLNEERRSQHTVNVTGIIT